MSLERTLLRPARRVPSGIQGSGFAERASRMSHHPHRGEARKRTCSGQPGQSRDAIPSGGPGGRSDSILRERATSAAGIDLRHRPSFPGAGGSTKAVIPTTRDVPTASTPDHGLCSSERRPNAARAAKQARRLYRSGQSDSPGNADVHRRPRPTTRPWPLEVQGAVGVGCTGNMAGLGLSQRTVTCCTASLRGSMCGAQGIMGAPSGGHRSTLRVLRNGWA